MIDPKTRKGLEDLRDEINSESGRQDLGLEKRAHLLLSIGYALAETYGPFLPPFPARDNELQEGAEG